MSYATAEELAERITESELIRLTDEDDLGAVNTDTVAAALEAADEEIDSYLAANSRYTLPLAGPVPLLATLAIDIAIWNLYALDASGVPENRKERYQAAVKTLERLASGKQSLGASEPAAAAGGEAAVFFGPDRLFDRNKMKGL